jgi:hypothetical protein
VKSRASWIRPLAGLAWLCFVPAASGQVAPAAAAAFFPAARFHFDAGAPLLAPAGVASDGTLCVGTVDGYVHALGSDGSYRWSYRVQGAVTRRPVSAGQLWYIATSADRVYALNREGALQWVFKPPSPVSSELAADASGALFFIAADHFLYGVSARGGVTLRAAFGRLKEGPDTGPGGAVFAENQLGATIRVSAQGVRRFAPHIKPEFEFPDLLAVRDPSGHRWRARNDGVLEFYAASEANPSLLTLARSPLLSPVWSEVGRYAVFSARSGVVFALDAIAFERRP